MRTLMFFIFSYCLASEAKKVCLLWEKYLFGERELILGSEGFRILDYTVLTLV